MYRAALTSSIGECIPQSVSDQRLLQTSQEVLETPTHNVDVANQCLYHIDNTTPSVYQYCYYTSTFTGPLWYVIM